MRQMAEVAQVVTDYREKIRLKEEETEKQRMQAWFEYIDREQERQEIEMRAAAGFDENGDKIVNKLSVMQDAAMEFGERLSSSFEQAILKGARLKDIMQGLLQDILKIATRALITAPLGRQIEQAISSAFVQSGTNVIQSAGDWNAAVSAGIPNIQTGSAKALGGPVSFGTSYLVGEKGPEIFTPAMNGTITPNHEIGGGVTVYQNINISTGVAQTVRAEVVGMMPRIMEATKAAVVDSKRRGGSFAKAFS